jgi:hypothetical protein
LVSLAGVAFLLAGVIITALASYSVTSLHWGWGIPFVIIGVTCLVIGLVIPLLQ